MTEEQLGPMPEPDVSPPDENPGGADAINEDTPFSGDTESKLGRDLRPEANPGAEDHLPDEIQEPEDKKQEGGESDGASDPQAEDPA